MNDTMGYILGQPTNNIILLRGCKLLRRGRYYDETRDDRHEIQEDEDRNEVNYTAVTG